MVGSNFFPYKGIGKGERKVERRGESIYRGNNNKIAIAIYF